MRTYFLLAAAMLLPAATAAADQPGAPKVQHARPDTLVRLVNCRTVAEPGERLACFDREVAALDAAEARRDLVVVDREQRRKTRKTLFGLTLPNLSVFGDDNEDQQQVSTLEAKIRSVSQNPYGKWILTLDDGARWAQTDTRDLPLDPRPGQVVKIRRAAMGSYLANVAGQVGMRVERVR